MKILRQPWNVFVFLFRRSINNVEFVLLKRKDDGIWQSASGGGEDEETPEMAAHREAFEETGLPQSVKLYKLDTMSYMEANIFKCYQQWGEDIYVVPMYYYAAEYNGDIKISEEHSEYGWFNYDDAHNLLYWHDNKTALWELNERLKKGNLIAGRPTHRENN